MYCKGFSPKNFKVGEFTVLAKLSAFNFPVFFRGEVRISGGKVFVHSEYFSISFRSFERFVCAYLSAKAYRLNYPSIWKMELEYHQAFLESRGKTQKERRENRLLASGLEMLFALNDSAAPMIADILKAHHQNETI